MQQKRQFKKAGRKSLRRVDCRTRAGESRSTSRGSRDRGGRTDRLGAELRVWARSNVELRLGMGPEGGKRG
eukprot:3250801-Rhodomonas_salina.1